MNPILIAGAGPTGLTAALLLSERGIPLRIVDKAADFAQQSKALAVNPRTLSLLEPSGVTEQLLAHGRRLQHMNVWHKGKRLVQFDLSKVEHRFNFMLIHPQGDTERLLAAALQTRGVAVEHNTELTTLQQEPAQIVATLLNSNQSTEQLTVPALLGADGAHSTVRHALNIDFPGNAYEEIWKLYDLELDLPVDDDQGHVFLLPRGMLFALRLRENVWRLISNVPDQLEYLPPGSQVGSIAWESDFVIHNRVASRLQSGTICLAGDAAHIHSPLGARGMNLGVEDAYVFASLLADDRLQQYESLRRPVVDSVVKWVRKTTELPRGHSLLARSLRKLPFMIRLLAPRFAPRMRKWVMGLDHEVH